MARAKTGKPTLVTIPPRWQLVFITAAIGSQVVFVAMMLASILRFSHYQSSGTWAFQITQWVYPLLYLAVGYIYARRRIKGMLPTLFWATFIATIGMTVWGVVQSVLSYVYSALNWWPVVGPDDKSWWSAFGTIWTQMLVAFGLYCLALGVIVWKDKRR